VSVVFDRNRRLERVLIAGCVVAFVAGIFQLALRGLHGPPLVYAIAPMMGLLLRMWMDNWRAIRRNARVEVDREGVSVDGVRVVEAAKIAKGFVQPRKNDKPTVRLFDKRGVIVFEVEVEDEEEGAELLRKLGHDAATRKARFSVLSPAMSTQGRGVLALVGLLAAMLAVVGGGILALHLTGAPLVVAILPMFVAFAVAMRPMTVDVGADGISTRWNGRRRFISFDDVREITTPEEGAIRLMLASGKHLDLRLEGARTGRGLHEQRRRRRDALLQRIREAMEAHRARIGPRELGERLARSERDKKTWLTDLRKLKDGEGGYRAAAVREEDLWRIVEDPGAPEESRAAAALLLRSDDGAKQRLRVAADAVASPRLRVALEADDDEAVDEALDAYCNER